MIKNQINKAIFLCGIMLLTFASQSSVYSQNPLPPTGREPFDTTKTNLGALLETEYKELLSDCPGSQTVIYLVKNAGDKVNPTKNKKLSAIPIIIQNDLGANLDKSVWTQSRDSLARLLSFAYTTKEIPLNQTNPVLDNQIFKQDFTVNPTTFLESGTTYTIYSHNCSRVLTGALKAAGGYKLPIASLESALSAEANKTDRNTFLYVKGPFISPFANLLFNRDVNESDKLEAYLNLWNWYRTGVSPQTKFYIIRTFNGVALFKGKEEGRKTDGSISLSGNVSVPFASVEANASFITKDEIGIKINKYDTYAFTLDNTNADVETKELPNITQTKEIISAFPTSLDSASTEVVERSGQVVTHTQTRRGIPKNMCNRFNWMINTKGFELKDAKPDSKDQMTCRFEVNYKVTDADMKNLDDLVLNYTIISREGIAPVSGADNSKKVFIELPTVPITHKKVNTPDIVKRKYEDVVRRIPLEGGNSRVFWEPIKVEVVDSFKFTNWAIPPSVLSASISCPEKRNIDIERITIRVENALDDRNRYLFIDTSTLVKNSEVNFNQTVQCKLVGTIRFMKNNPGTALIPFEKAFPDELYIQMPTIALPPSTQPVPTTSPAPNVSPSPTVSPTP